MTDLGTILVVDDSLESLQLLDHLLSDAGFQVRPADRGELALVYAEATPPDLVLLDVRMPGLDGFEVCRRLKAGQATQHIPILFMSGVTEVEDYHRGFELGGVDFITKPFQEHELLARVRTHLELSKLQKHLQKLVEERTFDLASANEQLRVEILRRDRAEQALRESEQKYRQVADCTYDWEWMVDPEGKFTYSSPSCARITGWLPEELPDIGAFEALLHAEDTKIWQEHKAFTNGAREHGQIEFRIHHRDGNIHWIAHVCQPVFSEGCYLGQRGSNRDITDRKLAEAEKAELIIQHHRIQKAESLGLMAGSIAHLFNNKLQSVMANLDVLSRLPKEADSTRYLAQAKQAARLAAEVSNLLLVYLGQNTGKNEVFYLSELCHDSLACLQDAVSGALTLELDDDSHETVLRANPEQFHQVLFALITNAWEAQWASGGDIRLKLGTCPAAKIPTAHRFPIGWQPQQTRYASLEVIDQGCGIAEEELEKLFDPFFSTKFIGRGLGLPAALGIVQAHGGAIAVESRPGQGSVFRVYLPISTEEMPSLPERAVQAPEHEGGGTLLVVDDDEMLLMSTGALVDMLGFTMLTAKDGVEALDVFRQHQAEIRCVLTDLTMPRLDGWGLLSALRQLDPNLPVILASGYDKAQVLTGGHPDRPQAFLSKPFDLEQLRDALGQALVTSSGAGH